jgi:regulator of sirC expression with transglutaminase-like and TPR domain
VGDPEWFRSLVAGTAPDLEPTITAIATYGRPEVASGAVSDALDRLAGSVDAADADALISELFGGGRLRGDRTTYHHPDNNLIDRVLERGLGIPLSLTVVAVLVGRRIGVQLGVAPMPGHILATSGAGVLYDVFTDGQRLDVGAARVRHEMMFGTAVPWHDGYVEPADTMAIATRWVANLTHASATSGDRGSLLRALRLESCLTPLDPPRRLLVVTLLEESGAFGEAAGELEALASESPEDADDLLRRAVGLRARLN